MWGGNGLKWKFSLQTISKLTRKERERSHPERDRTQSPKPFDFAPFDFAVRLQLRISPRSHPSTSPTNPEPFDFTPFNFAVWLRLRITPKSHPSTSPANPEPRSCLRLCRDRTLGSHQDGIDRTEIAIEKWLGFDEFFLVGFCFCVYLLRNGIIYLFGNWENVRNKKKMCFLYYFQQHNQIVENIFQSIFWNATKHLKIFSFSKNSISGKYLFSEKYFTWIKHSLKHKN